MKAEDKWKALKNAGKIAESTGPRFRDRFQGVRTYWKGAVILPLLGLWLLYLAFGGLLSGVASTTSNNYDGGTIAYSRAEGFGFMFWATVPGEFFGGVLLLALSIGNIRVVCQSLFAKPQRCREAALRGDAKAQFTLAMMYLQGVAVREDDVAAERFCRMAAQQGYRKAQSKLGEIYKRGWGAPKDLEEAERWFRLAAAQGDKIARFRLQEMHPEEFPAPPRGRLVESLNKTGNFIARVNRLIGGR